MPPTLTAAEWAEAQVALVRDDPRRRRALAQRAYGGPTGDAPDHLPYRRAMTAFIDWQLRRGVLARPDGPEPGSRWWRAVNERLLRDGTEAVGHAAGRGGEPSSPTVTMWMEFVARPGAATWYRAHNASIVAGYLDHRALADAENETERFFLNVVLLRVLFAHAMVSVPRMAVGWLAPLSPVLGDPRVRMTGLFLSVTRVLPQIYPLRDAIDVNARNEHGLGRLLDFGIIGPRLDSIYDWSADALGEPRLRSLIVDGSPCDALPAMPEVWNPTRLPLPVRVVRRAIPRARTP